MARTIPTWFEEELDTALFFNAFIERGRKMFPDRREDDSSEHNRKTKALLDALATLRSVFLLDEEKPEYLKLVGAVEDWLRRTPWIGLEYFTNRRGPKQKNSSIAVFLLRLHKRTKWPPHRIAKYAAQETPEALQRLIDRTSACFRVPVYKQLFTFSETDAVEIWRGWRGEERESKLADRYLKILLKHLKAAANEPARPPQRRK